MQRGTARGGARGAGPPPGTLALGPHWFSGPQRARGVAAVRRASAPLNPSPRTAKQPPRQRTTPPRPGQRERPEPGRACTPGLPFRHPQAEGGLQVCRYHSGRAPAWVPTYTAGSGFHRRRSRARRLRISCPQNVHHGSPQRRCGSCSRPARFKFPGVPAFRLAGSSLRCAPIGVFKKHVKLGGVTGPRRRDDSIARYGSGRTIPERFAVGWRKTPDPGMQRVRSQPQLGPNRGPLRRVNAREIARKSFCLGSCFNQNTTTDFQTNSL